MLLLEAGAWAIEQNTHHTLTHKANLLTATCSDAGATLRVI